MSQGFAKQIRRKTEDVSAQDRRPERSRHAPAQQERGKCRQRQHQHRDDVVGCGLAHRHLQRDRDQRRQRYASCPREVDSQWCPNPISEKRVQPVREGKPPPVEKPHMHAVIGLAPDVVVSEMPRQTTPEIDKRNCEVEGEDQKRPHRKRFGRGLLTRFFRTQTSERPARCSSRQCYAR